MIFLSQGHLLTEKVRNVLKDFVHETEGGVVTYAYSTAFQNLLTDIETAKKVVKTYKQMTTLLCRFTFKCLVDQRRGKFLRTTISDVACPCQS